jgi:hypothetical protein
VPDEVLFVNGIPLALVECKKPGEGLADAVRQHLRYADRRGASQPEGNSRLFHTMQLLIATSGEREAVGSITSGPEHYAPWPDSYPLSTDELVNRLDKDEAAVSQEDILAAAVLDPVRLLDIVHKYVTFMEADDGKTVKAVPRYQQYRAVSKAVDRLLTGRTRREDPDGEDRRGGVVWHTQGSGKSLTMSFLVRKLRTVPGLRKTKVVVVTDRTQLQVQLGKTMQLAGEPVNIAKKITKARQLLAQHGPGIVFVMIQKQQGDTQAKPSDDDIRDGSGALPPELNTDESIVVLIDEAHRSHTSTLHANLLNALPNCARIGFTGILDSVLPRPDALPFIDAAKLYAEIARRTRRRYRLDGDFDPSLYGAKVRELIDQHMIALGVDDVLPPVSITDPDYQAKIARLGARAKASEMEHAIRHHIRLHRDEHPVLYRRLSEDLERILAEHAGNWEQLALSLTFLLEEITTDDPERMRGTSHGLNQVESALYGVLAEETSTDGVIAAEQGQRLAGFTHRLHDLAATQTTRRDFWRHTVDQYGFISELATALVLAGICDQASAPALADKLFEVIRANRHRITPEE